VSTKTYPLKLPASLKEAAARLAKADGVSLNQWIATAVAQKVGVVETARDFLLRRAGAATGEGMSELLELVPAAEPAAEDRVPGALQGSKVPRHTKRRH
jgi:hypothetical protein